MAIKSLEKVNINNSEQWILVCGKNSDSPLIIHVQAGPGLPIIHEAKTMQKLLDLEKDFLVAYWDQRACGKSFHKNTDAKTITLSQLTDDVITCTQYLLKKYKKDAAILVGYSIGATISLLAANKNSQLFNKLFLVGIDIDIPTANKYALEFILTKAQITNNKKAIRQVATLKNIPITNAAKFQQRARLLANAGGIKTGSNYDQLMISTIKNMLFSKEYRLNDILKTIKGMEFCQKAFLAELDTLDLFEKVNAVDVPVHFIQGRHDGIAPYQTAVKFYKYLRADKTFTDFEQSAHMPQLDEPEKFARLLRAVLKNKTANY